VTDALDSDEYFNDVPALALTEEFTWDEWTQVRHTYLKVRHAHRSHPEEWSTTSGFAALALSEFRLALKEATDGVEPRRVPVDYPLEEVHTLMADSLDGMLLACVEDGVRRSVEFWESGLLPLLTLQRLSIEHLQRLNLMAGIGEPNREPLSATADVGIGVESWIEVAVEQDPTHLVLEGHLEDVAYQVLAHDDDAVVSLETLDGGEPVLAVSRGLLIGRNPLLVPQQGDRVRLRRWRPLNIRSIEDRDINSDTALRIWADSSVDNFRPAIAVMTRTVLLESGGESALLDWRLLEWGDLLSICGWAFRGELDSDVSRPARKPNSIGYDLHPLRRSPKNALERLISDVERDERWDPFTGEQIEWSFNRPELYRLVAGRHPGMTFTAKPAPRGNHPHSLGYWSALLDLVVFNLGWSSPGLGFSWWQRAGLPTDHGVLRVIHDVWVADDTIGMFTEWVNHAWQGQGPSWPNKVDVRVAAQPWPFRPTPEQGYLPPHGLHLDSHCDGPMLRTHETSVTTVFCEETDSSTVLIRSGLAGWYHAVTECNPEKSVHLIVPSIGLIGVFRQSPTTTIWHSATEEIHLAGNSLR
jgi:hypothetical protein